MSVSQACNMTVVEGEEPVTIFDGPGVVTSIVVQEMNLNSPVAVAVLNKSDMTVLMTIGVVAGDSFLWTGEPFAVPNGLQLVAQYGAAGVTVCYR